MTKSYYEQDDCLLDLTDLWFVCNNELEGQTSYYHKGSDAEWQTPGPGLYEAFKKYLEERDK